MRNGLRRSKNSLSRYNAKLVRFGASQTKVVVLLNDVVDVGRNFELVSDHLWVHLCSEAESFFDLLHGGEVVTFLAVAKKYIANGSMGSIRTDYSLSKVSKLEILRGVDCAEKNDKQ